MRNSNSLTSLKLKSLTTILPQNDAWKTRRSFPGDPFLFLGWGLGFPKFSGQHFSAFIAVELLDLLLMATFLDSQFSRSDSGGFAKFPAAPLGDGFLLAQGSPTHGESM